MLRNVGRDNFDLFDLFVRSYVSLLLDSPYDTEKPIHVVRKFYRSLVESPLKGMVIRYASLADELMATATHSSDSTITGEFLDGMKDTPIFREYLHYYRTGDARVLQYVLTFLMFGKKLDYVDKDLEPAAFRDWLSIEHELRTFRVPMHLVPSLRKIVSHAFEGFDDSLLLPKHGPGMTSEGDRDPYDKIDHMSYDAKALHTFRATSFGRVGLDRAAVTNFGDRSLKEQVAKLRFVPKSVKTMRSICMEPISRMYLQQEVARWIISSMNRSCFGRVIDFNDQEYNRQYAYHASYSQSCDTIDLSAASDRVHIDLVRALFPKEVLYYLLGTRTSKVECPNGEIIELEKFAPMGSALCFPIQSILFASIVLLAAIMQQHGVDPESCPSEDWPEFAELDRFVEHMHTEPGSLLPNRLLRPRIFGDDIVSDYRITDYVLVLLARCGLVVNEAKSFIGGMAFRESCGIFAYNGEDVTPCLFRVKNFKQSHDCRSFASVIDAANRYGDFKYHAVRSTLINHLFHTPIGRYRGKKFIPFTATRSSFGIFTLSPKYIINRDGGRYQRLEKKTLVIKTDTTQYEGKPLHELYRYDQWIRARVRGGSDDFNYSSSRIRPQTSRVSVGWTPAD